MIDKIPTKVKPKIMLDHRRAEKSDDIDDIVQKIDKITGVLEKIADIAGKAASIV